MIEITEKYPANVHLDNVNHPSHYETGKIECIDVMLETQGEESVKAFCICNALKYLYRHKRKNGVEDVEKARWYIDKYLEIEKGGRDMQKVDLRLLSRQTMARANAVAYYAEKARNAKNEAERVMN